MTTLTVPTPRRLRVWLARSLANRVMGVAIALTMLVASVIGVASFVAVSSLIRDSAHATLAGRVRLLAQQLSSDLNVTARDLADLSANAFVANGLVDSAGRETYLFPFLRDHRIPAEVPIDIVLSNFRGVPLAANRELDLAAFRDVPGLHEALATGRAQARLARHGAALSLFLLQPVIFPPTGQTEGLLVARLALDHLFRARLGLLEEGFHGELYAAQELLIGGADDASTDLTPAVSQALTLAPALQSLGLAVTVRQRQPQALGLLRTAIFIYVVVALGTLVAVTAVSRLAARRITRPLGALADAALEISTSGSFEPRFGLAGDDEVGHLGVAFNAMLAKLRDAHAMLERRVTERTQELGLVNERLRTSLAEREALLREVHHRVKNNLAVVGSLIGLQAEAIADAGTRSQLAELKDRTRTMALIHEHLYRSDNLARIDFGHYLQALTREILSSRGTGAGIQLHLDVADVALDVEQAAPCGMLVNELLTNSNKYAFPPPRCAAGGCEVHVQLQRQAGELRLTVADNGVGLPPGMDWRNSGTLGLQLVHALARQIGARVEARNDSGTVFTFWFKERS